MGGCLPLLPLVWVEALGFLVCLGVLAFLGTFCTSVQFLCIQSICQLSSVSGVLCLTFFVSSWCPIAWGNRDEDLHLQRASCPSCWHLGPSPQDVFLLYVSWLQLDRTSSGRKIVLRLWPRPSSLSE